MTVSPERTIAGRPTTVRRATVRRATVRRATVRRATVRRGLERLAERTGADELMASTSPYDRAALLADLLR